MPWTDGGLHIRGELVATVPEIETLRSELGEELTASATLAQWLDGQEIPPHSVGVALETQLRMLFDDAPGARAVLVELLDRLAEAFPEEVQPLDTS